MVTIAFTIQGDGRLEWLGEPVEHLVTGFAEPWFQRPRGLQLQEFKINKFHQPEVVE